MTDNSHNQPLSYYCIMKTLNYILQQNNATMLIAYIMCLFEEGYCAVDVVHLSRYYLYLRILQQI